MFFHTAEVFDDRHSLNPFCGHRLARVARRRPYRGHGRKSRLCSPAPHSSAHVAGCLFLPQVVVPNWHRSVLTTVLFFAICGAVVSSVYPLHQPGEAFEYNEPAVLERQPVFCVTIAQSGWGPPRPKPSTPRMVPYEPPTSRCETHAGPVPTTGSLRPPKRQQRGHRSPEREPGLFRVMRGPDTATVWTRGKQAAQPIGLTGDTTPTLRIASP